MLVTAGLHSPVLSLGGSPVGCPHPAMPLSTRPPVAATLRISPYGSHMSTSGVYRDAWRGFPTPTQPKIPRPACCLWMCLTPPKLRVPGDAGFSARIRRKVFFPILGNTLSSKDSEKISFSLEFLKMPFPQLYHSSMQPLTFGMGDFFSPYPLPFSGLYTHQTPISSSCVRTTLCGCE